MLPPATPAPAAGRGREWAEFGRMWAEFGVWLEFGWKWVGVGRWAEFGRWAEVDLQWAESEMMLVWWQTQRVVMHEFELEQRERD